MAICFVGLGNIGSAILKNCDEKRISFVEIEEYRTGAWREILAAADHVLINLPVDNDDGKQDSSLVNIYLEELFLNSFGGLILITSTILPKSIKEIYLKKLNVVLWPQFANERNAAEDFYESKYFALGSNSIIKTKHAEAFIRACFAFNHEVKFSHTSFEYASYFKYLRNLKMSYNIGFWMFVFEMSLEHNFDYRKIREMLEQNPMGECSSVADDGFLGFGGTCLPKDLKALNDFFPHELLQMLDNFNERVRNE